MDSQSVLCGILLKTSNMDSLIQVETSIMDSSNVLLFLEIRGTARFDLSQVFKLVPCPLRSGRVVEDDNVDRQGVEAL